MSAGADLSQYDREAGSPKPPAPDPTRRTMELVDRALSNYKEVVETRLDGIDKATTLVAADVARISAFTAESTAHHREDVDRQLAALRESLGLRIERVSAVAVERFGSVDMRFQDRDERVRQAAAEGAVSLNAALAAQSASVAQQNAANATAATKQEVAFQKLLDQLSATMAAQYRALDDKILDLQKRLERGEGSKEASAEGRTEQRLNLGQFLVIVSVLIAAVGLILAFRPG